MTPGDELEAALQQRWSFDELEVYADYLLSRQDVRGDLVALDLSPRPDEHAWVQRRRNALARWLGGTLAARCGHLVQHGFLHELRDGMAPLELLASDAGTYLRGYTTWGRTRVLASLVQLAAKPRPWLSRLAIVGAPPLPRALVTKLIEQTPRLAEITICGQPPCDAFPHPAVKRARLDARCYAIEIDAAKTRIDVPDRCPGAAISDDDLDLVMQLVELAPDCNQLYTHGEQFAEPVPALIARLAAAGLVELAGPVVRVATPGMTLAPRRRRLALDELQGGQAWIVHDRWFPIADLRRHGALIQRCLEVLPVAARLHDTLVDYLTQWERAAVTQVVLDGERCGQYRAAMNALLELRGLWPVELGSDDDWELVEELGASLSYDGAYLRPPNYYDWY